MWIRRQVKNLEHSISELILTLPVFNAFWKTFVASFMVIFFTSKEHLPAVPYLLSKQIFKTHLFLDKFSHNFPKKNLESYNSTILFKTRCVKMVSKLSSIGRLVIFSTSAPTELLFCHQFHPW